MEGGGKGAQGFLDLAGWIYLPRREPIPNWGPLPTHLPQPPAEKAEDPTVKRVFATHLPTPLPHKRHRPVSVKSSPTFVPSLEFDLPCEGYLANPLDLDQLAKLEETIHPQLIFLYWHKQNKGKSTQKIVYHWWLQETDNPSDLTHEDRFCQCTQVQHDSRGCEGQASGLDVGSLVQSGAYQVIWKEY